MVIKLWEEDVVWEQKASQIEKGREWSINCSLQEAVKPVECEVDR